MRLGVRRVIHEEEGRAPWSGDGVVRQRRPKSTRENLTGTEQQQQDKTNDMMLLPTIRINTSTFTNPTSNKAGT